MINYIISPWSPQLRLRATNIVALLHNVFNSRRMREGYSSRFVCASVCVCYHASCHIPCLYVENKVLLSYSTKYQHYLITQPGCLPHP